MKNVKGQLTQRDINLIEYCLSHLPINSDIAATLFYPNKYIAQRRLTTIHKYQHTRAIASKGNLSPAEGEKKAVLVPMFS